MAFSLVASTEGASISLTDGNPFSLRRARGFSGSDIVRHEQRGAIGLNARDLGFRLRPRDVTLDLLFYATTDSELDTHRKTLYSVFRGLTDSDIVLTVTRDDGEVRVLFCEIENDTRIELHKDDRVAHLHHASVRMRASKPLWRPATETSSTFSFAGLAEWWLAGGAIAGTQVLEHTENPTTNQVWNTGTIVLDNWAMISLQAKDVGDVFYATNAGFIANLGGNDAIGGYDFNNSIFRYAWPGSTSSNIHIVESRGTSIWSYWDGSAITQYQTAGTGALLYSEGEWRSPWSSGIEKAMLMVNATSEQLNALVPYYFNTVTGSIDYVNDGDVNVWPLITLRGPLVDPVIVNTTMSSTVDLTGLTLGSTDIFTIDLRDGDKRAYLPQSNQLGSVTDIMSLTRFYLAPAPIAAGGTNTIALTYGSVGTAAYISLQAYNQYLSF